MVAGATIAGAPSLLGKSAAPEAAWQAGVQQSMLLCSTAFLGISLPMVQPGIAPADAAAVAVTGTSASPSAQSIEMISLITLLG
jgi:hypothetical protein